MLVNASSVGVKPMQEMDKYWSPAATAAVSERQEYAGIGEMT